MVLSLTASSYALDLEGVQSAALDQPKINALIRVSPTGDPIVLDGVDFWTNEPISYFNLEGYLDTGASGILLSAATVSAAAWNIPGNTCFSATSNAYDTIKYADTGLGGKVWFDVSSITGFSFANSYYHVPIDTFTGTTPDTTAYTLNVNARAQLGVASVTYEDPIDQLINELMGGSIDVFGTPVMKNKVVVMDPKPVDNFPTALADFLSGFLGDELPDITMHTFLYNPGTPYNPAAIDTNPGIPVPTTGSTPHTTTRHIQLSMASFNRFTETTPTEAVTLNLGPTLETNPFIGKNPVHVFDQQPTADVPAIQLAYNGHTAEGSFLLDTGAAASILSTKIAEDLGVFVRYEMRDDGWGTLVKTPILYRQITVGSSTINVDLEEQFSLPLSGIGGTSSLAGFFLDSLLLPTNEGVQTSDTNYDIRFLHAPILVGDISLEDPTQWIWVPEDPSDPASPLIQVHPFLTLDGIFGMNYLVASMDFSGEFDLTFDITSSAFNWIVYDHDNATLTLDLKAELVPEPASLGLLLIGGAALLRRHRR